MTKALVLLHPFPLSSAFWSELKPIPGYQLMTPDFPNFGGTNTQTPGYSLAQAAKDLNIYLSDQNAAIPITLVGISMGGYLAFEYLRQFQNQVEKLVLISTRPGADKPEGRQNRLNMAKRVEKEGVSFIPEAMIPSLLGKTTLAEKPQVKAQVAEWILKAKPADVALAQRAMANREDQTSLLGQIRAKTLIIAGQEDALIPNSESVAMHQAIPGSQLNVIEKVGHLMPIEAPEIFQKSLEEFVRA